MSKKSFVKGAGILAVSGLIVKFIGAVFRIPLTNIIGTEGIGLYQLAYPIYAFLLVASTSGLPVAISKMVSEEIALGNHYGAYRIFRISLRLLTLLGIVTSIILLAGSGLISKLQGNPKSIYGLMAISPALFFVSVMSAYRGYFQGMHMMTPTALSQIIEQLGKLIIGLTLAALWIPKGPEYAAAGAILGVTLSEVAALTFMLGVYHNKKTELIRQARSTYKTHYQEHSRSIIRRIIQIAVPVTIGASIMPLVNFADQIIVVNRLEPIIGEVSNVPHTLENFSEFVINEGEKVAAGLTMENAPVLMPELYAKFAKKLATSLYGILSGAVNTLINFPAVLTVALAMSLVPAISESFALKDHRGVADKTTIGIRLTLLLGVPAAVGLAVLAEPILKLLYGSMSEWEYAHGVALLTTLSIGVIFLTLIQSLTAMLQGIGKTGIPVKNLFVGAIFKVFVTYVLAGMPRWNVRGAAIGTVICYGVAAFLDFAAVIRYTGIEFSFKNFILKPVIAVGIMGIIAYYTYDLGYVMLGSNTLALLISILAGIIIYVIMLFITGSITKQDFEYIPGGRKLGRILNRLGFLR